MKMKIRILLSTVAGFLFCVPFLHADDAGIKASLSSDKISLGESAELTVTVTGDASANPKLPDVTGLRFDQVGRSTQIQIINWKQSINTTLVYQVVASKAGEYSIPPITTDLGGKTYQTLPLKLTVLKQVGGGTSGALSAPDPSSGIPATPQPEAALPDKDAANQLAFVRISDLPEKLYVGQVTPVTVRIYIQQRMQARNCSQPVLHGDAFTFQPLRLQQEQQVIEGIPYLVLTAPTTLSAIKEGDFPLSFDVNITVLQQEKSAPNDAFGNNPFFSNFFVRTVAKTIPISSPQKKISVLALPSEGKPASFNGAIGKFELNITTSAREVHVGDPLNLKMEITGRGNFDRVTAPVLEQANEWKTYAPGSNFKPADSAGYEGTKTFEQVLIPQDAESKSLPAVEFCYFDPENSRYEILKPPGPAVAILPATDATLKSAKQTAQGNPAAGKKADMVAIHVELGSVQHEWKPLFQRPWFWALQGVPLMLGLAGLLLKRRHARMMNPEYRLDLHVSKRVREAMGALESALANEDSASFAEAACRALSENYARRWRMNPESITLSDIRERLGSDAESAGGIFEMADAVSYAGRRLSRQEMLDYKERVLNELKQTNGQS